MEKKTRFMPPEWAEQRATWIAWPHLNSDFPGKIDGVRWAYVEFIRHLSRVQTVEILCATSDLKNDCVERLERSGIKGDIRFHVLPYERTWLRDSAPTLVKGERAEWVQWNFTAWAKYDNFGPDQQIPQLISEVSHHPLLRAVRPDNQQLVVLEGGAFDVDGAGSVLVTEECLLSQVQERNPGLSKRGYEEVFAKYLGATNTIWLGSGCSGDDTHGHIDDIARFISPTTIVCAVASPDDREQFETSKHNVELLKAAKNVKGQRYEVVEVPYPSPLYCDGTRLPASYMNFYIANGLVLVPTFNDERDREVLALFAELMPGRRVIGINCSDWVLGYGSLHCSTQQEPR